jgi:proteasome assembly chaperone 3
MDTTEVKEDPFPAPSKQAMGQVDGVETEASSTFFSDKIMVIVSQAGRLSQLVSVQYTERSVGIL